MYTQEELLNALQEAGADGRPFTLSSVRTRLGLASCDKHELDRFRRRVRSLQKASDGQLERVGNNSYRLKASPTHAATTLEIENEVAPQLQLQAAGAVAPQPSAAGSRPRAAASARMGLCARSLALGQRVAHLASSQFAQRHAHRARLRALARELKPKAEALRAIGIMQLQALRERVAAVRRPTA